jgi:tetratricopeptide (TPR) repeat protein
MSWRRLRLEGVAAWLGVGLSLAFLWVGQSMGQWSRPLATALLTVLLCLLVAAVIKRRRSPPLTYRDFEHALDLSTAEKWVEAIDLYDRLIVQLRGSTDVAGSEHLSQALLNRGWAAQQLGRPVEALASFDELIEFCSHGNSPQTFEYLGRGLLNKARIEATLGHKDDAARAAQEVLERFRDSGDPSLRALAAIALLQAGARAAEEGSFEDALALYSRLDRQFAPDRNPQVERVVADGAFNGALTLGHLNRPEQAIAAYERVAVRFGDSPECDEVVASALVNRGVQLLESGSAQSAVDAFAAVISRWELSANPAVRASMAKAWTAKGNALVRLARPDEAEAAYRSAIEGYGHDPQAQGDVTIAIDNLTTLLASLGRSIDAPHVDRPSRN